MSLSGRIFLGLLAGVATGLFLGELAAPLKVLGDIFIKLLQITVLPYIVVSLVAGIGQMDAATARHLAWRGSLVLLAIWALALVLIFLAGLAFPDLETRAFFGSTVSAPQPQVDLLELYLPANIFYSLANNLIPAVVLFSILLGVALIAVEDKGDLLALFNGIAQALARINAAIVQLTPLGVFAIAAAAAGTLTVEQLGLVQVYLVTYICLALLVTFWIFPGLVATLSGIPFREVLDTFRDALVTAFATGNQFVVLPQIAENCKTLLARHGGADRDDAAAVDVIVPVSFNFPSLGKLLVLLYVLFAAWFTDTELDFSDRLGLAFNGLFSLFGSLNVAVPYLLDSLRVPADMFQLFLVTGIVVGRFGAMLAALHIIVLAVLGTLALAGRLQVTLAGVGRYLLTSGVAMLLLVALLQGYFALFVPDPPNREAVLRDLHTMRQWVQAEVLTEVPQPPRTLAPRRLDQIWDSGLLRVGYRPANLPCTFLTSGDRLVGFDAEMAQLLARDMGVGVQFVPFTFERLGEMLDSGQLDLAMSCIASLPDRYASATFSRSYLDLDLAFIVQDHERGDFASLERLRERPDLSLAVVGSHYFTRPLRELLPGVEIVVLESADDFFSREPAMDALLLSAQEGAAYAYRYPRYSVVTAEGGVRLPAAYPLPRGDPEFAAFISNWIELKQKDGTIGRLYGYWMEGGAAQAPQPRWSVLRDVLGWID